MKKSIIFILMALTLSFLSACKNDIDDPDHTVDPNKDVYSFVLLDYMATSVRVNITTESREKSLEIREEIRQIFDMYHQLTTSYEELEEDSPYLQNIFSINKQKDIKLEIDKELYDVLLLSEQIKELTNGYFDIAVGTIVDHWKNLIVPEEPAFVGDMVYLIEFGEYKEVLEVNQLSGRVKVEGYTQTIHPSDYKKDITKYAFDLTVDYVDSIDSSNFSVLLSNEYDKYYVQISGEDIKLDLGAISKGYAAQKAADYLSEQNVIYYSISAGTSSLALGQNANREGNVYWVSLTNPVATTTTKESYGIIHAKDTSVTTSGNYEQYIMYEGNRYHHIVSPKTKMPAQFYHTVSIIGQNAALLDALSTALFSMPKNELEEWITEHQTELDLEIIVFNQDRTVSEYLVNTYFKRS
jgi:thiamine biosynthesis lipoprotein